MEFMADISESDPLIHKILLDELKRSRSGLEMIASENYVSKAVMQVTGSVLTNKYSEGYPKRRYYSGNEFIDMAENLAMKRAKQLFGVEFANVQPHSGSSANMEAYYSILDIGDKILSMSLDQGGHLTHGHSVNFSGKHYKITSYGVDEKTHFLDMDDVRQKAKESKPKLIVAGFSAYTRELDFKHFSEIAEEVGALLLSDVAHIAGLIAAKQHPDPAPHSDLITTTTHKTLRGPRGALIMGKKKFKKKVNRAVFPGMQGGPLDHVIAAKAVAFKEAMQAEFSSYISQVKSNAKALATGLVDNEADIVTGGTDNHIVLLDISKYGMGGKIAEQLLDKVGIFTNKNAIPFDTRSPFDPSGIRLGTAALTTRGLGTSEMLSIGELICKTLNNYENNTVLKNVADEVESMISQFPLYPNFEYLR